MCKSCYDARAMHGVHVWYCIGSTIQQSRGIRAGASNGLIHSWPVKLHFGQHLHAVVNLQKRET